jgi:hypothetical protein
VGDAARCCQRAVRRQEAVSTSAPMVRRPALHACDLGYLSWPTAVDRRATACLWPQCLRVWHSLLHAVFCLSSGSEKHCYTFSYRVARTTGRIRARGQSRRIETLVGLTHWRSLKLYLCLVVRQVNVLTSQYSIFRTNVRLCSCAVCMPEALDLAQYGK